MQVPQIRMQSQTAQIAIQSTPARQSIQQPKADLHIEQPLADMKINTILGRLTIDQTQAWEDMNIRSPFRWSKDYAQKGHQAVMQAIARISSEGDEMMEIQNGQDVLIEQAKRNANPPPAETNIAWIPSVFSVKINYQPGKTNINVKTRHPIIDAKVNKPIHQYQLGKVNVSLTRRHSLQIDFVK